jgi:alpha-amylase
VIWITPPVEQIHGAVDEGSGKSYGFHGYWAKDFTRVDANLGNAADVQALVDTAHRHGIRVLLDVVMNHTGPVTELDPVWPDSWVRMEPACTYRDIPSTVSCTLVKGLPDIKTESQTDVELPPALVAAWKSQGRYDQEMRELDAFFARTGYPRAPRYYLMKWHTDWVRRYGFDGFRADTVKHVEPEVWGELKQLASNAFDEWKAEHPDKKLDDTPFYMTAEVYGYRIAQGQDFVMDGGSKINFFAHGFDSLINFGFKNDAKQSYEELFANYAQQLHGPLAGYSVLNYLSSHDDMQPYDAHREHPFEAATRLLLSPGVAQIYYGDESARRLDIDGAEGDAKLRSPMNWDALKTHQKIRGYDVKLVLAHWQKLGRFRQRHPAIAAGEHRQLVAQPYTFARILRPQGKEKRMDKVVVALDLPLQQRHSISVAGVFADGSWVRDAYSGQRSRVVDGKIQLSTQYNIALIERDER